MRLDDPLVRVQPLRPTRARRVPRPARRQVPVQLARLDPLVDRPPAPMRSGSPSQKGTGPAPSSPVRGLCRRPLRHFRTGRADGLAAIELAPLEGPVGRDRVALAGGQRGQRPDLRDLASSGVRRTQFADVCLHFRETHRRDRLHRVALTQQTTVPASCNA